MELAPFGHTYDDRLLTACGTDIKIKIPASKSIDRQERPQKKLIH